MLGPGCAHRSELAAWSLLVIEPPFGGSPSVPFFFQCPTSITGTWVTGRSFTH